jgi:hypothetical protein
VRSNKSCGFWGWESGAGFRVQSAGFRVQGSGFRVQGSGFRVQGSGFRVEGWKIDRDDVLDVLL